MMLVIGLCGGTRFLNWFYLGGEGTGVGRWRWLSLLVPLVFLVVLAGPAIAIEAVGDNSYPPHVYVNAEGEPDGFDIEVLKRIAEIEGWDMNINLSDWYSARNAVIKGQADILVGVVKTPDRTRLLDFSEPYMESRMVIFVYKDNYYIHSLADLRNRRLGLQKASMADDYLKESKYRDIKLYRYPNQIEGMRALCQGKIDAMVGNYYTGMYWLEKEGLSSKVKIIGEPLFSFSYHFAVTKGRADLVKKLNHGINVLKQSGELQRIKNRWFGQNISLLELYPGFYKVIVIVVALLLISWGLIVYMRRRIRWAIREIQNTNKKLQETYETTVRAIIRALEKKERGTANHTLRVNKIAMAIGEKMGLSNKDKASLNWGTLLHDIGKLGISDQILIKKDPLNPDEIQIIKAHPQIGYDILDDIDYLAEVADIALSHHERYDGKGYPRGLKGEEIPFLARICSVADAFEAMTSDRPYRKAMSLDEAVQELKRNQGTQFDPAVVEALLQTNLEELIKEEPENA